MLAYCKLRPAIKCQGVAALSRLDQGKQTAYHCLRRFLVFGTALKLGTALIVICIVLFVSGRQRETKKAGLKEESGVDHAVFAVTATGN